MMLLTNSQIDRQTNKQTDGLKRPTHADVGEVCACAVRLVPSKQGPVYGLPGVAMVPPKRRGTLKFM